jgi:hypothetical protein
MPGGMVVGENAAMPNGTLGHLNRPALFPSAGPEQGLCTFTIGSFTATCRRRMQRLFGHCKSRRQRTQKHHRKLLNITRSESFTRARPIAICLPSGEKENVAVRNGSVSKWVICVALPLSKG